VTPDDIADRADRELDREERERLAVELDDSDARDHVLALLARQPSTCCLVRAH
jgi:hypothetical protein